MNKTLIQDIVKLVKEGWRPYNAQPERGVYERIGCDLYLKGQKNRPFWFVRGDIYCCVGCVAHCTLNRPTGFPLSLPIKYATPPPDQPYTLTQEEMVTRFKNLTVRQASYCLNVSDRQVYDYIADGRLIPLKEKPLRVRSAEVKVMMNDYDE